MEAGRLHQPFTKTAGRSASAAADDREPVREGKGVRVGGADYTVPLTRQLNPAIAPADAWYDGPPIQPGEALIGVFVQACNHSHEPLPAASDFYVRDALDNVYRPVELGEDNPFDYEPRRLEPGDCTPEPNSEANLEAGAALIAFRVPQDALENRPWTLTIEAPPGHPEGTRERGRVELDL